VHNTAATGPLSAIHHGVTVNLAGHKAQDACPQKAHWCDPHYHARRHRHVFRLEQKGHVIRNNNALQPLYHPPLKKGKLKHLLLCTSLLVREERAPRRSGNQFRRDAASFYLHGLTEKMNKLTPWNRIFLQKLTVAQPVNKLPALYGTRRSAAVFTRFCSWLIPTRSHKNPTHNLSYWISQVVSSLQNSRLKFCMHFSFILCVLYAPPFDSITLIIFGEK
jgi:hypothetical protein